jgi:hypothetical protein
MPGRIQVSEQFRNLTAAAFRFVDRGTTDIKSIGATRTFFLVGEQRAKMRAPSNGGHPLEEGPAHSDVGAG